MKKYLLSYLAAAIGIALIVLIGCGVSAKADGHIGGNHCVCGATHVSGRTHTGADDVQEWTGVTAIPTTAGTHYVYLTQDVTLTGQITFPANETLYLCLNGHTIKAGSGARMFMLLNANVKLVITNCCTEIDTTDGLGLPKGKLKLTANYSDNGAGVYIHNRNNGHTFELYNGTIQGGGSTKSGTAVFVDTNSTFNMYGGALAGNEAAAYGGNVYVPGGTFNMYGGTVTKGSAVSGANVYVGSTGTFTMRGGEITNGNASSFAGAVLLAGGTFTMHDGTIGGSEEKGNKANTRGGSVYVTSGTLTMNGGEISYGSTMSTTAGGGGNVTILGSGAQAVMNGGTISSGTAQFGGNVWVASSGTFTMEYGRIEDGVSTGGSSADSGFGTAYGGGNLCLSSGNVMLKGGLVRGGSSVNSLNGTRGNNLNQTGGTLTLDGATVSCDREDAASSWNIDILKAAVFRFQSGEIVSNDKGNVLVSAGTFEMTGGTIHNTSETAGGTNLYISATATISGGEIYGGRRMFSGGGGNLFINGSAADVTISGTAKIHDGQADHGGNISIVSDQAQLKIEGGEIYDGFAYSSGGNLYASSGFVTVKDTSILRGEARNGGNVCLTGNVSMTVEGSLIEDGFASDAGDNFYVRQEDSEMPVKPSLYLGGGCVVRKTNGGLVNVAVSGGSLFIDGATVLGAEVDLFTGPKENTDLFILDGYFGSIFASGTESLDGTLPVGVRNKINGGYFGTEPRADLIAEGMAALRGNFTHPDPSMNETYGFVVDDASKGVLIDAQTTFDVSGIAGAVEGIGLYLTGQTFTLSASPVSGFAFDGWYEGNVKTGNDTVLTGTATAEKLFEARFLHPSDTVLFFVNGRRFDLECRKDGSGVLAGSFTGRKIAMVPRGTEYTVTYTGDEESRFAVWLNESNKILTDDPAYSGTVHAAMGLTAASAAEPGLEVRFVTEYNQLYATLYVRNGQLSGMMPGVPLRIGATASWDKTEDEILTEAENNEGAVMVTLTVTPLETPEAYTVTVKRDGAVIAEVSAEIGKYVTVNIADTEGFYCVKDGDTIVSYEPRFEYKAVEDKELTAVYAAGEKVSVVTMTAAYGTAGGLSFASARSIAEGDTIIEQGILYSIANLSEENFKKGENGVGAAVSASKEKTGVTTLNISTSAPKTVYARAYIVLMHEDGTVETIYSGIASATSGEQTEPAGTTLTQPEKTNGIYLMQSMKNVMKTFGRTAFNADGSMMNDWSGSGFEVVVNAKGGDFAVHYRIGYEAYYVVEIDGAEAARPFILPGEGAFSVFMEPGIHTVRVIKDTEIDPTGLGADLVGVDFAGTFYRKPEKGTLKVEIIGDSISAGKGSLGVYQEDQVWTLEEHSGTHSFTYYLTKHLNWDTSVISKGGIGLVTKAGNKTSADLYPYVSGYRNGTLLYDFASNVPDLVIVALSSNDGSASEAARAEAYSAFFATIREKYGPDVPIIWVGKQEAFERTVNRYVAESGDLNTYACRVLYGGHGSKALLSQTEGHPNAEEQNGIALQVEEYLRERGFID